MSALGKLLAPYIQGTKGYWYYDFMIGQHQVAGGYFRLKCDCRRHMKNSAINLFPTYDVAVEYFTYRKALK